MIRAADLATVYTARRRHVLNIEQLELLQRISSSDEPAAAASLYLSYQSSKQTIRSRLESLKTMALIEQQPLTNSGGNTHDNRYAATSAGQDLLKAWPETLCCRQLLSELGFRSTSQRSINIDHVVILASLHIVAPEPLSIDSILTSFPAWPASSLRRRTQILSKLGFTVSTGQASGKPGTPSAWIALTPAGDALMSSARSPKKS